MTMAPQTTALEISIDDTIRIVKHTKYGVWDFFEEDDPSEHATMFSEFRVKARAMMNSAPYVWRALREVLSIPGCKGLVFLYTGSNLVKSLVPAVSIWFQGQLIRLMETAIETGHIDTDYLYFLCAGRVACSVASDLLSHLSHRFRESLNLHIQRTFALRTFSAYARLDVPTFERPDVTQRLGGSIAGRMHRSPPIWTPIDTMIGLFGTFTQAGSQLAVLFNALRGRGDSAKAAAAVALAAELMPLAVLRSGMFSSRKASAVTSHDPDYIKVQGWKHIVGHKTYRKELVAGNLAPFAIEEYRAATERLGDAGDVSWNEVQTKRRGAWRTIFSTKHLFTNLPQIAFTLHAARDPRHMAEALASLHLVQTSAQALSSSIGRAFHAANTIGGSLSALRDAYEGGDIENIVPDGTVAFSPSSDLPTSSGVHIEFRNVSFKYPGTDNYALKDVSFTLLQGQLCVIVGANGAGKSTILKLILRLYDPNEGTILLDGFDIRTFKLSDVRRAMTVLFQDYSHFPLSVRDNIALGYPDGASTDEQVREAAALGGAAELIESLPRGYNAYLRSHVPSMISAPGSGSRSLSGKPFDSKAVAKAANIASSVGRDLSGGQMQRLAIARTFMRSVRAESQVGLLLFDEPSASLDPIAEHELFTRLREFRGQKTMVFSSHRFGKLTRHADLILYMNASGLVESGGHDVLLERDADYARLWKMQAEAFL
ncbi:P-loop containing nucleoside triphosphate hydrolase protein [Epithele typhae]|uniref:P-loop containing nucleoside triphosphate hydrolase protein n=1 Tax=Epithele typhae TaxID=378194 RepID=UPI0020079AA0|nr:P-loop containing nucleoside triphosphate hydrolase protein [Epithele typhae]KAH9942416.1 P-loop containing nucleoside triphosphate hydrolase protein [Epithele typhae]